MMNGVLEMDKCPRAVRVVLRSSSNINRSPAIVKLLCLRIDNSGCSVICAFDHISKTMLDINT